MSERMTDPKGMRMVYIPTGKFLMGSTERQVEEAYQQAKKENKDADKEWFTPEIPQHEQVIQTAFWLDLSPVTNASYARFMQEGGYSTREFWTEAGWKWLEDNKQTGPKDYPDVSSTPDQPRVGVTWFEAYAYCQWRGGRLPTEAEWEWAARGTESRIYPWGNDFVSDYAIWEKTSGGRTAPVSEGIRTAGASWIGALDMSGNVWDWCNSLYQPYPYEPADGRESNSDDGNDRVLRGGAWRNGLTSDLRAAVASGGRLWLCSTLPGSAVSVLPVSFDLLKFWIRNWILGAKRPLNLRIAESHKKVTAQASLSSHQRKDLTYATSFRS